MRKLSIVAGIFIIFQTLIYSQVNENMWDREQLSNSTVMLYQPLNSDSAKIGTGTIITNGDRYFILTASHIVKILKNNAMVVFHYTGDKAGSFPLKDLLKNNTSDWKHHKNADMALAELEPTIEIVKKYLKDWSFPFKQIYDKKEMASMDAELTFFGFPILDLEGEHFSPLIFSANRSSGLITQQRYDEKIKCNFFYLNSPSVQGCSGSGVFFGVKKLITVGKTTMLIGIIHGTQKDNTGGKMAAVIPSYYLNDILKEF